MSAVREARAVVLCGAAGCGKSTRVPAALVRASGARARVLAAEPRRVAAAGLAARVADELGEQVGETVGYQVRLDVRLPRPTGHALYCTSGVLLKKLQSDPGLEGTTHVILDEAHERDVNTDLALPLLKRALGLNQNLKLIVMSATLNIDVFTRYFDNCPVIQVPGRTFPVDSVYLEDFPRELDLRLSGTVQSSLEDNAKPTLNYQEIAKAIESIDKKENGGGILVFLPGWAEIKAVKALLEIQLPASRYLIMAVHSKLSVSDQSRMLSPAPPLLRKIVLATNIAETSLTIPDVTCVVDAGAARQTRLRSGASSLELGWISRASAKQRQGRAGRVRPGRCYKLYSRAREAAFAEYTSPEILRVPLEKTVLDCKACAPELRAAEFLAQLPEPPAPPAVHSAVRDLVDLGALSPTDESLTALGRMLATISLHPRLACALAHAAVSGTVGTACRLVTHMGTAADIFLEPNERREEIREIKSRYHRTSDHLATQRIVQECVQLGGAQQMQQFCCRLGLRQEKILESDGLSKLHLDQLLKSGLLDSDPRWRDLNRNSDVDTLALATVFSGVDSLLMSKFQLKTKGKIEGRKVLYTSSGEHAHLSTDSVNRHSLDATRPPELFLHWGGVHSVERRALMPRGTSQLSPLAVLLFTRTVEIEKSDGELTSVHLPRHRLAIHIPSSQVELVLKLRNMLWETFQYYIERDKTSPEDSAVEFRENLVDLIANILRENEIK